MKDLFFVGRSREDLKEFPEEVQDVTGYALYVAQLGQKHRNAKPLKGFGGAGVLEVVEYSDGNAHRTVYTVRYTRAVYVLHAFQKKSTHGISTPAQELDLVRSRLRLAADDYRTRFG